MHSWPITVFAPMLTSPSCTRILQPCPIHAQRPIRSVASRPISSFTPGQMKQMPSVCRRLPKRSFSSAIARAAAARSRRFSMRLARMKRSSASGPPCSGAGAIARRIGRTRLRAAASEVGGSASSSIARES